MSKIKKIALDAGIVICILAVIASGFEIVSFLLAYKQNNDYYNALRERYFDEKSFEAGLSNEKFSEIVDWDGLISENQDIIAWIVSPGTEINYPVVQADDNDLYLYRMTNMKKNSGGALFADCNNKSDFSDYNTVIYGHSMKNGAMFGALEEYKKQAYYDEHSCMYLFTAGNAYKLELLCGFSVTGDSDLYLVPGNASLCANIVNEGIAKSTFTSKYNYNSGEKTVTLSTCGYKNDLDRFAVIGRLVDLND